jgi:hypothetical protein
VRTPFPGWTRGSIPISGFLKRNPGRHDAGRLQRDVARSPR